MALGTRFALRGAAPRRRQSGPGRWRSAATALVCLAALVMLAPSDAHAAPAPSATPGRPRRADLVSRGRLHRVYRDAARVAGQRRVWLGSGACAPLRALMTSTAHAELDRSRDHGPLSIVEQHLIWEGEFSGRLRVAAASVRDAHRRHGRRRQPGRLLLRRSVGRSVVVPVALRGAAELADQVSQRGARPGTEGVPAGQRPGAGRRAAPLEELADLSLHAARVLQERERAHPHLGALRLVDPARRAARTHTGADLRAREPCALARGLHTRPQLTVGGQRCHAPRVRSTPRGDNSRVPDMNLTGVRPRAGLDTLCTMRAQPEPLPVTRETVAPAPRPNMAAP